MKGTKKRKLAACKESEERTPSISSTERLSELLDLSLHLSYFLRSLEQTNVQGPFGALSALVSLYTCGWWAWWMRRRLSCVTKLRVQEIKNIVARWCGGFPLFSLGFARGRVVLSNSGRSLSLSELSTHVQWAAFRKNHGLNWLYSTREGLPQTYARTERTVTNVCTRQKLEVELYRYFEGR